MCAGFIWGSQEDHSQLFVAFLITVTFVFMKFVSSSVSVSSVTDKTLGTIFARGPKPVLGQHIRHVEGGGKRWRRRRRRSLRLLQHVVLATIDNSRAIMRVCVKDHSC